MTNVDKRSEEIDQLQKASSKLRKMETEAMLVCPGFMSPAEQARKYIRMAKKSVEKEKGRLHTAQIRLSIALRVTSKQSVEEARTDIKNIKDRIVLAKQHAKTIQTEYGNP